MFLQSGAPMRRRTGRKPLLMQKTHIRPRKTFGAQGGLCYRCRTSEGRPCPAATDRERSDPVELTFEQGDFEGARMVRTRVFMEEQGFRNEFDDTDRDERTVHVTLRVDGELAGCARIFPDNRPGASGRWIFGRLAVLPDKRGNGLGAALLAESERLARQAGAAEMRLHAQCRAEPFYERSGYRSYGPVEMDEHVEHVWMRKAL